jgi:NADPH:quinone reductase-like Zn-dependent oxidoreductase
MILGCDARGWTRSGNEVVVHSVGGPGLRGAETTLDPGGPLLSERHQGTLRRRGRRPAAQPGAKPAELSWRRRRCLPRLADRLRMLFTQSGLAPGGTVLVQGRAAASRPR